MNTIKYLTIVFAASLFTISSSAQLTKKAKWIYLVHAQEHPTDRPITPQAAWRDKGVISQIAYDAIPQVRLTTHHYVNNLVQDHADGVWSHLPYALIEPLQAYAGQILGGNARDVITVGTHIPSRDSVAVVPASELERLRRQTPDFAGHYFAYPEGMNLQTAVDIVLNDLGAFMVQEGENGAVFADPHGILGTPFTDEARLRIRHERLERAASEKRNINTAKFFQELDPDWDFFDHPRSVFNRLEKAIAPLVQFLIQAQLNGNVALFFPSIHDLALIRAFFNLYEPQIQRQCARVLDHVSPQLEDLARWMRLIDREIELRLTGHSLLADAEQLSRAIQLRKQNRLDDLRELGGVAYVSKRGSELADVMFGLLVEHQGFGVIRNIRALAGEEAVVVINDAARITQNEEFRLLGFLYYLMGNINSENRGPVFVALERLSIPSELDKSEYARQCYRTIFSRWVLSWRTLYKDYEQRGFDEFVSELINRDTRIAFRRALNRVLGFDHCSDASIDPDRVQEIVESTEDVRASDGMLAQAHRLAIRPTRMPQPAAAAAGASYRAAGPGGSR